MSSLSAPQPAASESKLVLFPSMFRNIVEKSKLLSDLSFLAMSSVVNEVQLSRVCDAVVSMSSVSDMSSL